MANKYMWILKVVKPYGFEYWEYVIYCVDGFISVIYDTTRKMKYIEGVLNFWENS